MATQYTVKYIGWESSFEDFGADFVNFISTASAVDNPDQTFPVLLPYKVIIEQAEEMIPGVASIISRAQKQLKGWGLQESEIVRELEELGIDLEAVVLKTIAAKVDLEKEYQRVTDINTCFDNLPDEMKEFDIVSSDIKTDAITHTALCTQLEKVITQQVVDQFPVIINSSPDCILQLQKILNRILPVLAHELTTLIRNAEQKI